MNNNYQNLVSIIIPARNVDFLLEDCIEEIRKLYKEVRIILVLDEINKNLPEEITILKSKSLNMSAKRNQGVEIAKTKYIAFLDSDSYPKENWLEIGVKFLENNETYSAVTGNQFNPPTDTLEQKCLRLVRFNRLFTHKQWQIIIDEKAKEKDCTEFMTSNVIMRRNDYVEIGGMNEKIYLAEDNEFSKRLTKNGYKIRFIPSVCVFHREATMYSFFRKIYCISYYYANTLVKFKPAKSVQESLIQLLPFFAVLIFLILFFWGNIQKPIYLAIFPILAIILLINEAKNESQKLKGNKTKGFLIILFAFCIFCAIWVIGTFLGLINFPSKDIHKCYKHY